MFIVHVHLRHCHHRGKWFDLKRLVSIQNVISSKPPAQNNPSLPNTRRSDRMWSARSENILFRLFRIHSIIWDKCTFCDTHRHTGARDLIKWMLWWLPLHCWNEDFSAWLLLTCKWISLEYSRHCYALDVSTRPCRRCQSMEYSAYRITRDVAGSTFALQISFERKIFEH